MSDERALSVSVPGEGRPRRRVREALERHKRMALLSFGVFSFAAVVIGYVVALFL